MELHQLQLLLAVIESGGYAQAGKTLHLSHSAIHRQIALLENEAGCRLLARAGRRVEPTEAGQLLASLARQVRQEVSDAQRQINDLNKLRKGRLRIGTSSSMLITFLPDILRQFSKKFPGVHLRVATGIADDLVEDVLAGRLDVAIVFNPQDLPRPVRDVECRALYREEFDWAVGKGHPLAKRSQVTLEELAASPFITLPPKSHLRRACDRMFAHRGLSPTVVMELENEEAIDKLVELNMGFALRSRRRPASRSIRCFRIPERTVRCDVGIIWRKRSYVPLAILEFIRMCSESSALSTSRQASQS